MNKYYVYLHRRASDNKPFYVGKGSRYRAWDFSRRNPHWQNIKNKHGVIVDILFENLAEEDAFQIEKDTILEFTYFGYSLCNKTAGGEGISGHKHSKEIRQKIADSTVYTFVSKDNETFIGTRFEFQEHTSIDRVLLSQMFTKTSLSQTSGWTYLKDNETIADCAEKFLRRSISKADRSLYHFQKLADGLSFTGTRTELSQKFDLNQNELCAMFSKRKRKSSQGWTLIERITHDNPQTKT